MSNVTIAACANSTPPAGTVVATCALSDSSNAQLMMLSDQSRNIYGVTGSPLVVSGSAVVTNQVSASISNTLTVGNLLSASISNSPSVVVSSGSLVVTNGVSASISNTVNVVATNLTGSAAGSPTFVSVANLAGSAAGSPLFVLQTNNTGSAAGSPTFVSVTNAASVVVSSGSVVVTNGVSASISNTVTVAQGASGACPWGVRVLDAAGNAYGVAAGSPLYITGGAAGGTSATDQSAYAAGTTSFTPVGGFYSTNPVALTACQSGALRLTAQRAAHVRLSDESGNVLGVSGSPIYVTGGAGGTSATDEGTFAEGAGTYTPAGFWYLETSTSLTASQAGIGRMTAWRAAHVNLRDASSNQLGVSGSPLFVSVTNSPSVVVSSGSVVVTNSVSASISNTLTVGNALSASLSGGSVALLAGANTIGAASAIQGAPAGIGAAWMMDLTDGTDTIAIDAASRLLTATCVVNTASVIVSSGSAVVTNIVSTSVNNFPTLADKATFAEGTTVATPMMGLMLNTTACLTASQVGAVRINEWRAQHVTLRTASGNELGAAVGSPLFASIANLAGSAAGSPLFMLQTNNTGSAAGSPTFVSITNLAGSAGGSPLFVSVTNQVSASISNTACVVVSSGSVVVTNALSASISGGSVALLTGANVIGSASVIQGTAAAITAPWPVKLSDGTDSATVTSSSAVLFDQTEGQLLINGSALAVCSLNISSSTAGCIILVAGLSGDFIRVIDATFTTSNSQNIGFISGSAASTLLQSPMPFGAFGGMDVKRGPYGYLWQAGNGCALVMTTTSACIVAGNLSYIVAPS